MYFTGEDKDFVLSVGDEGVDDGTAEMACASGYCDDGHDGGLV